MGIEKIGIEKNTKKELNNKKEVEKQGKEEEIENLEEKFENIPEEEKEKFIKLTKEIENLYDNIREGDLEIGEVTEKIEEYKGVDTSNASPKKIEMPTVVDYKGIKTEGAILGREGVSTPSPEFKKYIESNTKVNDFLDEFYSSGDLSYSNFKDVLEKYKEEFSQHGFGLSYYKFGVSGDSPQRLTLEVFRDKAEEYKEKFFGEEENYDEKLEVYKEKQELINEFSKKLEKLEEMVEIDKKLILAKEIIGMDNKELKEYFDVKSLYADYNSIKDIISVMVNADFEEDGIYVKIGSYSGVENDNPVDKPENDEFLDDQDARRLWVATQKSYPSEAVKVYSTGITVTYNGEMKSIKFPPYREYEDFKGGQTHYHNENDVSKILNVKKDDKEIKVTYLDGDQVKREKTF